MRDSARGSVGIQLARDGSNDANGGKQHNPDVEGTVINQKRSTARRASAETRWVSKPYKRSRGSQPVEGQESTVNRVACACDQDRRDEART